MELQPNFLQMEQLKLSRAHTGIDQKGTYFTIEIHNLLIGCRMSPIHVELCAYSVAKGASCVYFLKEIVSLRGFNLVKMIRIEGICHTMVCTINVL